MYQIEIEDIERETGQFIAVDRKIKDLTTGAIYSISEVAFDGLFLKQIPYFRNKQEEPFQIDYNELFRAYKEGIFSVEGFEAGQEKELRMAISSLIKKIRICEKDRQLKAREQEISEISSRYEKSKAEKEDRAKRDEARREREAAAAAMGTKLIEIDLALSI